MNVASLQRTSLGLAARTVTRLHALDMGRGEPVLCLHSSTGSHAQWRTFATGLHDHARVIVPDLLGHGASPPWPARWGNILGADASAVMALASRALAEEEADGFHLVGHSYGAALALRLAQRYPRRVRSLTLYEPVAFGCLRALAPGDEALEEIRQLAARVAALVGTGDAGQAAQVFADYWAGAPQWAALSAPQRATLVQRIAAVPLHFAALFAAHWGRIELAQLAMPVLLLHGTRTREPARRVAECIAEAVPHARVRPVAGAGHLGPLTHREPVEGWMREHLLAHLRPAHSAVAAVPARPLALAA